MNDKFEGHTPGPWAIDWNVSRLDVFSPDATTLVATIRRSALSAGIDEAAKANARLIAAAPELLDERDRLRAENEALRSAREVQDAALACLRADLRECASVRDDEIGTIRAQLHEVAEEWVGAECGEPVTAQEAYAIALARRMYSIASRAALKETGS